MENYTLASLDVLSTYIILYSSLLGLRTPDSRASVIIRLILIGLDITFAKRSYLGCLAVGC